MLFIISFKHNIQYKLLQVAVLLNNLSKLVVIKIINFVSKMYI